MSTTIRRAELAEGETSMTTATDPTVRRTLEPAAVEFIDENGVAPAVRPAHGKKKPIRVPGDRTHNKGKATKRDPPPGPSEPKLLGCRSFTVLFAYSIAKP